MLSSNSFKTAAAAAACLALAACGNNASRDAEIFNDLIVSNFTGDIDKVRATNVSGGDFNAAMAREYKNLMLFEADQMYDYVSAYMYAKRSLAAAAGKAPAPLDPANFNEPEAAMPSLRDARASMMDLFGKGAREKFPARSAVLQSSYDCWIEQQEENHQPDNIAECRDRFVAALADLRKAMEPKPAAPAPVAAVPTFQESYTILFQFDSAVLSTTAKETLAEVVRALRTQNAGASIIGYTDTVGAPAYNQTLSEMRAKAVSSMVLEAGIRASVVTTEGKGETDLARPTGDNVNNAQNRRAVISIR